MMSKYISSPQNRHRQRSESSCITPKNYESTSAARIKKSVNFLNTNTFVQTDLSDSNDLTIHDSDDYTCDEPKRNKDMEHNKHSLTDFKLNSLSIYDNLNEFNNYLNKKIMAKNMNMKNQKIYKDNKIEGLLYSSTYPENEYSILPIQIDSQLTSSAIVSSSIESSKCVNANEASLSIANKQTEDDLTITKIDLSCSSNEKLGSSR